MIVALSDVVAPWRLAGMALSGHLKAQKARLVGIDGQKCEPKWYPYFGLFKFKPICKEPATVIEWQPS